MKENLKEYVSTLMLTENDEIRFFTKTKSCKVDDVLALIICT